MELFMLYDYKCHTCGEIQEVFVKAADRNDYQFVCKSCGGTGGERQISMPGFVTAKSEAERLFKGGGLTSFDTLDGKPRKRKNK